MTNQNNSEVSDLSLLPADAAVGSQANNKSDYDGGFSLLEPKPSILSSVEASIRASSNKRNKFQEFTFG